MKLSNREPPNNSLYSVSPDGQFEISAAADGCHHVDLKLRKSGKQIGEVMACVTCKNRLGLRKYNGGNSSQAKDQAVSKEKEGEKDLDSIARNLAEHEVRLRLTGRRQAVRRTVEEFDRSTMLIYGRPGVGKTRMCLETVKDPGEYGILLSIDKGDLYRRQNAAVFDKKIGAYHPKGLHAMRDTLEKTKARIVRLGLAGIAARNRWVFLDTMTHLQVQLLSEARKIDLKNPSSKDFRDEYVRDHTIQVDYGINLAHMSEVMDAVLDIPANIVIIALEKSDRDSKDKPVSHPQISGQSYSRIAGDVDVVARMVLDGDKRVLHTQHSRLEEAKDRSGRLDAIEPAVFTSLRDKILGPVEVQETKEMVNA